MGVDLETLRPEPTVEGYTVPGGYSCKAVRPIAAHGHGTRNHDVRKAVRRCPHPRQGRTSSARRVPRDRSLSAIGGVETGDDAAQFILLGAHTVQVCTGVMIHGYKMLKDLNAGLAAFMDRHGFERIADFHGKSLEFFTTHADLVERQAAAKAAARAEADGVVRKDADWSGDRFVEQTDKLVANKDDDD